MFLEYFCRPLSLPPLFVSLSPLQVADKRAGRDIKLVYAELASLVFRRDSSAAVLPRASCVSSIIMELVWFPSNKFDPGLYLFRSTYTSTRSGKVADWKQYRLLRAMGSCIFNVDGYCQGRLHKVHRGIDQYDTIHEFIAARYPGAEPYHAWVAQSWNGADNLHHAIDWYIQPPPEYLTSWYQHYHLTDISMPQEYWQSRVSKHIGMKFFDDTTVSASHAQANT